VNVRKYMQERKTLDPLKVSKMLHLLGNQENSVKTTK